LHLRVAYFGQYRQSHVRQDVRILREPSVPLDEHP
jgi:hypothetical protein